MNKIAIAQLESSTDKNKNLLNRSPLIQEAKSKTADLIAFPNLDGVLTAEPERGKAGGARRNHQRAIHRRAPSGGKIRRGRRAGNDLRGQRGQDPHFRHRLVDRRGRTDRVCLSQIHLYDAFDSKSPTSFNRRRYCAVHAIWRCSSRHNNLLRLRSRRWIYFPVYPPPDTKKFYFFSLNNTFTIKELVLKERKY